ncbi:MAG: hypothetical protein R3F17_00985 [Planctomycetota bacterium]
MFREFEAGLLLPLSEGLRRRRHHLGQKGKFKTRTGKTIDVYPASANPSHLEAVDPVVCGMTRVPGCGGS